MATWVRPAAVAAAIFKLEESWRTNFVEYVAGQVRGGHPAPTLEELTAWLQADRWLCGNVRAMLNIFGVRVENEEE